VWHQGRKRPGRKRLTGGRPANLEENHGTVLSARSRKLGLPKYGKEKASLSWRGVERVSGRGRWTGDLSF